MTPDDVRARADDVGVGADDVQADDEGVGAGDDDVRSEADEFADMPHYTRRWSFDPYHQNLVFSRQHAPARVEVDTEWADWEVFQQDHRGEHHHHVGSVHAPDAEYALVLAKENFARRGDCVNLWVVQGTDIHATAYEDSAVFEHTTDKSYREPAGYHGLRKAMHGRPGHDGAPMPEEGDTHDDE